MFSAITLFPIATTAAYVGVAAVRRWALDHQALDIPNQRSSHIRPTPRGGGLAIVVVVLVGWLASGVLASPETSWSVLGSYALGAGLVAAVSWLDDLYGLPAIARLAAHIVAASLALVALGYWQTLPLPGPAVPLGYAGVAIGLIWIIGLTNAYNFMDGSDGMAAVQGVIAGLGWALLGWLGQQPLVVELGLLLAAGSLGFLWHNWPPAAIFMGDVGSAFLGYSFAVLPLVALEEDGPLAGIGSLLGCLLLWPFIFDAAFTFFRRLRRGENVLAAHRSHLYQRLMIAGRGHRFVLLLYAGLATMGAAAALCCFTWPVPAFWCSFLLIPSLAWALHRFVIAQERRADEAVEEEEPQILPLPSRRRRAA